MEKEEANSQEGYVKHIRLQAQLATREARFESRTNGFNTRRKDFDYVAQKIKELSVEEFRSLCCSFCREQRRSYVKMIHQQLATGRPHYIDAFLEKNENLHKLYNLACGKSSKSQQDALHCFINLGFGTNLQCKKVCEKVGSLLVLMASGSTPQNQGLCAWACGNLCGFHPDVCDILRSQEFEKGIVFTLMSPDPSVVQSGCYALHHYYRTVPRRIGEHCTLPVVKLLLDALSQEDDYIVECSWCLFSASTDSDVCSSMVSLGVVSLVLDRLFRIVKKEVLPIGICTALLRLLSNCVATRNEVAVEICYQGNTFVKIVEAFVRSPIHHLQMETLQFVANVINGASVGPITGQKVMEDMNVKKMLEPILKPVLASRFNQSTPPNFEFTKMQV